MEMITENPCRFCVNAEGYLIPRCSNSRECEMLLKYHKYLKFCKEAKYKIGEKITSLDELNKCKWIYDTTTKRPVSIQVIRKRTLYSVIHDLNHGFYKKINIEKESEEN